MSSKAPIGDKDVLQRRLVANAKYDGVKPVVESGMTTELAQFMRSKEIKIKRQPGELFKRVRASTVAEALLERQQPELMADGGYAHPLDEYRGSMQSHTGTTTTGDAKTEYLILDCREEAEYRKCHINSAVHYPKIRINHSTNPFLPEMFDFKNKPSKLIVLYDLEEEAVLSFGNIIFEKGIDNVAVMAGGLREFVQDYSALITGPSPVPIIPRDARMQRRAEEVTLARSEARSGISRTKPKSLSSSLAKPQYRR